jgi:YVTN family beta-propeller protein
MYVANYDDGTVSVIDTTTNTVIYTDPSTPEIDPITVGNLPQGIAYDSENERMYVANYDDGTVSVIDTTTNTVIYTDPSTPEIDPITVGGGPRGIAYDSGNERMYVTNNGDNTVSVIDTTTNTVIGSPIEVAGNPQGITYSSTTLDVYVANVIGNTVSVIDTTTNTVIGSPIEVGQNPSGIAFDPINDRVYVTNFSGDTVSVINLC